MDCAGGGLGGEWVMGCLALFCFLGNTLAVWNIKVTLSMDSFLCGLDSFAFLFPLFFFFLLALVETLHSFVWPQSEVSYSLDFMG